MTADRGHLHHRLIDLGLNQKQAVAIMYSISSLLGIGSVVMAARGIVQGIVLILSVIPLLIVAFFVVAARAKEISENTNKGEEK